MGAILPVARPQPRDDIGKDILEAGKIGLLGQVTHRRVGLQEALAMIGLDLAGGDLEQGRFARAVAADKTDAVAALDDEIGGVDERLAAEGQADALQGEKGRSHDGMKRKMAARARGA